MLSLKKNRLIFVLQFFFLITFAQQFPSKNLTTLDGLSNNSVYAIFKDSRQTLWVGTANGLSAIHNRKIKNYYKSDGIAHNSCWAIAEDKNKNLWFGSYGGGLTFFDGKRFEIINTSKGLINDKIRTLFVYKNNIYVGTEWGLSVIDCSTHKIIFNAKRIGQKGIFQVMSFYVQKENVYFTTFDDGVWSVNIKSKSIHLENHDIPHLFSTFQNNNLLYVSHLQTNDERYNQFTIKNFNTNKLVVYPSKTIFWDYVIDSRKTVFGAGNGVNISSGGVFKISEKGIEDCNDLFGISSFNTWCLEYDAKLDLLYVGTLDKGLYIVDLKREIEYYSAFHLKKKELEVLKIINIDSTELLLSKNELIFLSHNNNKIEISKEKLFNFLHLHPKIDNSEMKLVAYQFYKKASFKEFELKDLKIYNSKIWLNTSFGLFEISKNAKIVAYHPFSVKVFHFINENQLLYQEPYWYFRKIDGFNNDFFVSSYEEENRNNPKDAVQILENGSKPFILTATSGLYSYKNGAFFSYSMNNIWKERELVLGAVTNKNQLVITNSSSDIFVCDVAKKFKIVKKIASKILIGKSISFLQPYKEYLIIGTEKGINIYKNGKIQLIDEEQGIINKIITCAYLKGDLLFIGTLNGYYTVNLLKYLNEKQVPLKIAINAITINSKSYFESTKFNSPIEKLNLPYDQNTLLISFEPEACKFPSKLLYRYKIGGGFKQNWSNWSKEQEINLTYLSNGNYTVLLQIKDLNSGLIHTQKLIEIMINPPFWKTIWFVLGLILVFVSITFIMYQKRLKFIKSKGELQKRVAETKMEALQSQMNPHFIFNAMNSIQKYILEDENDGALEYLGEFSKLIRATLDNSALNTIALEDEIDFLKQYIKLENKRLVTKVGVTFNTDEAIDTSAIQIPPMLLQPLVENVFLHAFTSKSKNPTLEISFLKESQSLLLGNEFLICTVKDNGKGMDVAKLSATKNSKGIKLLKERIALLQISSKDPFAIISSPKEGTKVILRIKIYDK